ncbi:hypothetical protein T439DRAFT_321579 [Meredithblackwellia eburnea MCA 4105]
MHSISLSGFLATSLAGLAVAAPSGRRPTILPRDTTTPTCYPNFTQTHEVNIDWVTHGWYGSWIPNNNSTGWNKVNLTNYNANVAPYWRITQDFSNPNISNSYIIESTQTTNTNAVGCAASYLLEYNIPAEACSGGAPELQWQITCETCDGSGQSENCIIESGPAPGECATSIGGEVVLAPCAGPDGNVGQQRFSLDLANWE